MFCELRTFETSTKYNNMEIKILGTGCSKCRALEKSITETVKQMQIDAEVTKVEDIVEIMKYGVMTTPALVVNNKILLAGRVPSVNELKKLLSDNS